MVKKLFVGNLSFQSSEKDIRNAFEQYGPVQSISVITDRVTGHSKGFGFIEMDEDDAFKAIAGLNGSELNGRKLSVNEAKPLLRRTSSDGEYRGAVNRRMRY